MEDANLPPAGPVNDISSIDALETTGTQVSGASYASSKEYPLDDLEVHQPGARVTAESFSQHTPKLVPLSRRRALVVSVIITVIVVLLTGASGVFFLRNDDPLPTNSSLTGVPSQDVQIEKATQSVAASELQGTKEALLVNGNVITRGDLQLVTGGFTTILRPETITANQTYLLPNASGTLCLNTNNCNSASVIQLQQLIIKLGE